MKYQNTKAKISYGPFQSFRLESRGEGDTRPTGEGVLSAAAGHVTAVHSSF